MLDHAAPLTTVAASAESATTSAPAGTSSTASAPTSSTQAPRDTVFRTIFGDKRDAASTREFLEKTKTFDRGLMRESMQDFGLSVSDDELKEYSDWVCTWVAPETRYVLATEGKPDSLQGQLRVDYDKLITDTVEFVDTQRHIMVTPEQVAHALPQAVLTTCLDEETAQKIMDNPNYF